MSEMPEAWEIPEGTIATVEISDGALPPTYTPFGELLRLRPASVSLCDEVLSPMRFSVRLCDVDPNLLSKVMAKLTFAVRIIAPPLQVDCSAFFVHGDEREVEFGMTGKPVFSMLP